MMIDVLELDEAEAAGYLTLLPLLASKLGSLVARCQEGIDTGQPLDVATLKALVTDVEVSDWLASFPPGLIDKRCPRCKSEYREGRNTVGTHEDDRYRYKPCGDPWHGDAEVCPITP